MNNLQLDTTDTQRLLNHLQKHLEIQLMPQECGDASQQMSEQEDSLRMYQLAWQYFSYPR